MSKIPSFSRHRDTATGHGVGPRSNFPRLRVAQSAKKTPKKPRSPSVEGNLISERTPRVQLPYRSVWRKKAFWTWLEEMFISSNMRRDISLLNVFCGAAMIEVCLWSKKYAIRWVYGVKKINTEKHRNTSKVSLLYLFYRKISKNNDI